MSHPEHTPNSEINEITARMQRRIDNCTALIIERAINHVREGDIPRGINMLQEVILNLRDQEPT